VGGGGAAAARPRRPRGLGVGSMNSPRRPREPRANNSIQQQHYSSCQDDGGGRNSEAVAEAGDSLAEPCDGWLARNLLEMYADLVRAEGYDRLGLLFSASEDEVDNLIRAVKMKIPHAAHLRKLLYSRLHSSSPLQSPAQPPTRATSETLPEQPIAPLCCVNCCTRCLSSCGAPRCGSRWSDWLAESFWIALVTCFGVYWLPVQTIADSIIWTQVWGQVPQQCRPTWVLPATDILELPWVIIQNDSLENNNATDAIIYHLISSSLAVVLGLFSDRLRLPFLVGRRRGFILAGSLLYLAFALVVVRNKHHLFPVAEDGVMQDQLCHLYRSIISTCVVLTALGSTAMQVATVCILPELLPARRRGFGAGLLALWATPFIHAFVAVSSILDWSKRMYIFQQPPEDEDPRGLWISDVIDYIFEGSWFNQVPWGFVDGDGSRSLDGDAAMLAFCTAIGALVLFQAFTARPELCGDCCCRCRCNRQTAPRCCCCCQSEKLPPGEAVAPQRVRLIVTSAGAVTARAHVARNPRWLWQSRAYWVFMLVSVLGAVSSEVAHSEVLRDPQQSLTSDIAIGCLLFFSVPGGILADYFSRKTLIVIGFAIGMTQPLFYILLGYVHCRALWYVVANGVYAAASSLLGPAQVAFAADCLPCDRAGYPYNAARDATLLLVLPQIARVIVYRTWLSAGNPRQPFGPPCNICLWCGAALQLLSLVAMLAIPKLGGRDDREQGRANVACVVRAGSYDEGYCHASCCCTPMSARGSLHASLLEGDQQIEPSILVQ
jgi:MFS family permease